MRLVRSDVIDRTLRDHDGRVVGTVADFFDYPPSSGDYWGAAEVTARHWHLPWSRRLVDLTNAQIDGHDIIAAHPVYAIRHAPRMRIRGALTVLQADKLLTHYWPPAPRT